MIPGAAAGDRRTASSSFRGTGGASQRRSWRPTVADERDTQMAADAFERVLVVGATGSIGRRVVAALERHALPVRGLVRDLGRGESVLPGVELVRGDVEKPDTLAPAVNGVDAVVFTHGGSGEAVDYGGVRNTLAVFAGPLPRIALMTSIGVTQSGGGYRELLEWKRRSERLVRASGAPYTIVRPGLVRQHVSRPGRPGVGAGRHRDRDPRHRPRPAGRSPRPGPARRHRDRQDVNVVGSGSCFGWGWGGPP